MQKLQYLAQQHEIRGDWIQRLRVLEGFSIVMLCDDSGSMATPCQTGSGGGGPVDPFGRMPTRWSELQSTCSTVVQLASALDPVGAIDVHFLNRPPVLGVQDPSQLQPAFAIPPNGYTPITAAIRSIMQHKQRDLAERRLLLVIATDGQPTDAYGNVQIQEFLNTLGSMPHNMYCQIMACTDDQSTMSYLNAADNQIPRLDVTDDFSSERAEILAAQGPGFHFTRGDYICKCLLGPVDDYFDSLDSRPGGGRAGGGDECCCIA
jgi:hypothetical protein